MKKILLVIAVVVVAVLGLAYVFGVFGVTSSNKADVGFMFDNAPTQDVVGVAQIWIDGEYNAVLTSAQGGFISLSKGSDHTFEFQTIAKTFTGTFHVPSYVPEKQCVIVHVNWNNGIVSVVVQPK